MNRYAAALILIVAVVGGTFVTVTGIDSWQEHRRMVACVDAGFDWLDMPVDGGRRWIGTCWRR